jgi:pimeloyl-ACP methyl ester carboxylesterase
MMHAAFALIHSPLVGPTTWQPVAAELRRLGEHALVPEIRDAEPSDQPHWQQEVELAAAVIDRAAGDEPVILVGHSGAGTLLPVIGKQIRRPVAGYLYVDAGLPLEGASRLAEMTVSSPDFANALRAQLERGQLAPIWDDDALRPFIPDDALRHQVIAELQPRPLSFYEEPIPSPDGWTTARSGYLLFSLTYASAAARAEELGWPCRSLSGGHFHMLVDPAAVAKELLALRDAWI